MLCAALCMADVLPMPLVFNAPIAGFEEQCPMGFWICTSGFLVTLLGLLSTPYWPISCSRDMAFVDVASIHQSDKRLMERGVFGIAGFLRVSKELRILHSIPYFARLWCVFECAAYRKVNPDGRIVFKPLFVERITFYLWASTYFFNFLYFIMREYGSAAGRQFTNLASFTVPFGVSCYALRMNFREEKHQLLSHLEKFQLDQARQKFPPRNRWLFVLFGGWIIFGWLLNGILKGYFHSRTFEELGKCASFHGFLCLVNGGSNKPQKSFGQQLTKHSSAVDTCFWPCVRRCNVPKSSIAAWLQSRFPFGGLLLHQILDLMMKMAVHVDEDARRPSGFDFSRRPGIAPSNIGRPSKKPWQLCWCHFLELWKHELSKGLTGDLQL